MFNSNGQSESMRTSANRERRLCAALTWGGGCGKLTGGFGGVVWIAETEDEQVEKMAAAIPSALDGGLRLPKA